MTKINYRSSPLTDKQERQPEKDQSKPMIQAIFKEEYMNFPQKKCQEIAKIYFSEDEIPFQKRKLIVIRDVLHGTL